MDIDRVCKTQLLETEAAATSEYEGKKHYSCAPGCKEAFDQSAEIYTGEEKTEIARSK